MEKKKRPVVGIDVSHLYFDAHWEGCDARYSNDTKGFRKLLKEAPEDAEFVMEATGNYHYRLSSYIASKGRFVKVVNPLRYTRWTQSEGRKAKTDPEDAIDLAGYAKEKGKKLREWKMLPPKLARAKVIVSQLKGFAKMAAQARCRIHAAKLVVSKTDYILNPMSGLLDYCGDMQADLEKELCKLAGEIYPEHYKLLQSITGIGAKTAAVMLVCAKDFASFETPGKLSAFFGYAVKVHESGKTVKGKTHMVKVGNSYLRGLLHMCANTAVQYDAACHNLYERLRAKGKLARVAQVAVAHRLVKIAWGVVNSGEMYRGTKIARDKKTAA
ncbi:MAG: IS110 family transposase [Fibromonadales bacterium]|nr:IS110 family transposase [Fibromonadales bacterium]